MAIERTGPTKWRVLRNDEDAQLAFITTAVGMLLMLVGLVLLSGGSWSTGLACIGVGCLLGGWGGVAKIVTPQGQIVGAMGFILLVVAFLVNQVFHR